MSKNNISSIIMLIFICLQNSYSSEKLIQEQLWLLETYKNAAAKVIVDNIRKDLLSEDVLVQDAGCIILLKTFEQLKKGDGKSDSIFGLLSADQEAVRSASGIIDSRLLGWYNPEGSAVNDDDMQIYVPLLLILGKADDKMARGTLIRSFHCLRGYPDILKIVPVNEDLALVSLKRLKQLEAKLCCVYPGRDAVAGMIEKDSRFSILEMFENYLMTDAAPGELVRKEMKAFIINCLRYGDAKNGYIIRAKAAALAGKLVKTGDADLSQILREIARTDPFYVHANLGKAGYSLKELHYPVREICSKILLR